MANAASPATTTTAAEATSGSFKHEPLDPGRRLIRLITVLSGSRDKGQVSCALKHVALPPPRDFYENDDEEQTPGPQFSDDEDDDTPQYTCLSYTWGEPDENHVISINEQPCTVRRNLFHFLTMAAENLPGQYFWIDALCIDQSNTAERNHQVQQMGNIYTRAKAVIIWLGTDLEIELTLHAVNIATRERAMHVMADQIERHERPWELRDGHISTFFGMEPPWSGESSESTQTGHFRVEGQEDEPLDPFLDGTGKVEKMLEKVSGHVYWSRAWVTQEVLLSRRALLVAGRTVHRLLSLARKFRDAVPYFRDSPFENLIDILLRQRRWDVGGGKRRGYVAEQETFDFKSWGLVNLLHRFRHKQCAIKRDRIYSLLALCQEGAKLKVDYSVDEATLIHQVLSLRETSQCFCSAAVVSNALSPWDFSRDDSSLTPSQPFAEIHMYAFALTSAVCSFCSNWVPFSWTRKKKGLVFCFRLACPDKQGHMFWAQGEEEEGEEQKHEQEQEEKQTPCSNSENHTEVNTSTSTSTTITPTPPSTAPPSPSSGTIYTQSLTSNKSHPLCSLNAGLSIAPSEWPNVYSLQFSLQALVAVLKEDSTNADLGLNACGNLWPGGENKSAASELGRLRLCAR